MQVCCALLSEKSIAERWSIDITRVHDWAGDSAAALGDWTETGIPQHVETRLTDTGLKEL